MTRLRDLSIRSKLLAIILLTSGVALVLACGTFAAYDWYSTRAAMAQRLSTMADVVGANSTAALVFDNPADASQTLIALRAEPRIVAAAVFGSDGTPFADYAPEGVFTPPASLEPGERFGADHLEVVRPIQLDGRTLGSIYLRTDLSELDVRMRRYGVIALAFLCVASLVTLAIASRLRAVISEPILGLLRAMQAVRDDPSYAVRAEKHGDDELGLLVDGFNDMVSRVAARDDALRSTLRDKEVLLKEVHHRVKNNLQIVASLLDLQGRNVTDPGTAEMLRDSRNRIHSMGLVHEHLYGNDELARINFPDYVTDLCASLSASYAAGQQRVEVRAVVDDLAFDLDTAIPCGLIINELVSNALKYAFPGRGGRVTVQVRPREPEGFELVVADDGVGLPEGVDPFDSPSLGLQLVTALARQIRGQPEFERAGGTTVRIRFLGRAGSR